MLLVLMTGNAIVELAKIAVLAALDADTAFIAVVDATTAVIAIPEAATALIAVLEAATALIAVLDAETAVIEVFDAAMRLACPRIPSSALNSASRPGSVVSKVSKFAPGKVPASMAFNILMALTIGMAFSP
jgi:hypothetical protein